MKRPPSEDPLAAACELAVVALRAHNERLRELNEQLGIGRPRPKLTVLPGGASSK